MAENATDQYKKIIEDSLKVYGYEPEGWVVDDEEERNRPKAIVGRFRITEDDEENGLFAGTEGVLSVSVVGGEQYNNLRAYWGFTEDGMDAVVEVRDPAMTVEGV